jgi:photosystem II stability/assembly factor-like uncharacterized protein
MRVLAFLVLLTTGLYPQWIPLNPTYDSQLYSMYFIDDHHGWISGSQGTFLKFNSKRFLWERQPGFTENNLYSIGFFDNQNGLSCGSNGTLLRSTDGGSTWFTPIVGLTADLRKIHIYDESVAYVAGESGILMKTNNKGVTWEQINPVTNNNFRSVFFIDEQFGFAGTDSSKILRTTNGGKTWSESVIPSSPYYPHYKHKVNDIVFTDSQTGYAGGGRADQSIRFFWKTTDGGLSWTSAAGTSTVHDIHMNRDGWGLIVGGESGWWKFMTLKSPDGTYTNLMTSVEDYDIFCCWITPSGQGWAAGSGGSIYYSSDFRSGWKQIYSGRAYKNIFSIGCSEDYFIIVGEYYTYGSEIPVILRGTFDTLSAKQVASTDNGSWSISLKDNIGYIADWTVALYKSSDLGNSWQRNYTTPANGRKIFFLNDSTGWRFLNYYGGIFRTTDRGITWTTQHQSFNAEDLRFIDQDIGFACSKTELIRTYDGGLNWTVMNLPFQGELTFVQFINILTGVVAGKGILYITQDGGVTWRNINPGSSTVNYTGLQFINNIIIVSSKEGNVLKSSDMGYNWSEHYIGLPVLEMVSDGKQNLMVRVQSNIYINRLDDPVPVELIKFTASISGKGVLLEWYTSSEINNNGFEIERKSNKIWETIGFIKGKGTSTDLNKYIFTDDFTAGNLETTYRLKQLDYSGAFSYSDEVNLYFGELSYELFQNYPNPFNPDTRINFNLPIQTNAKLILYDALGREVKLLLDEVRATGNHSIELDGSGLSSGVYFLRMQAGEFSKTRKLLLMK